MVVVSAELITPGPLVDAAWAAWPRGAWGLLGSRLAPWGAGLLLVFGSRPPRHDEPCIFFAMYRGF